MSSISQCDKTVSEITIFIRELIKFAESQHKYDITITNYRENGDISLLAFVISNAHEKRMKYRHVDDAGYSISGVLEELITPNDFAGLVANVKRILDSSDIIIRKGRYAGFRLTIDDMKFEAIVTPGALFGRVDCVFTIPIKSVTYEQIMQ